MTRHIPRKRWGQNFLVDAGVIAAIVAAIAPRRADTLVEIGPGLGALTGPLLERVDRLHVVEIDRDLVARLRNRADAAKLEIHEGDALEFDFATLGAPLRVVGNLPYNISTPLLFHLASYAGRIADMHFMLQKEVVERMVAEPGGKDYGRLSVMLQYRFHLDGLLDVPPECFSPPPQVDSAIVRLIPLAADELAAHREARLSEVVAAAFGQRRKMLRNTLRGVVAEEAFERLGIAPSARAEELSVADFVRLANYPA